MHEDGMSGPLRAELESNSTCVSRAVGTEDDKGRLDGEPVRDYFVERDGRRYAGVHLIVDAWGMHCLNDLEYVRATLHEAAQRAGATLLRLCLHHFGSSGGVSGVAVLAESHISIHTWPERDYAAFDVFMCGNTDPQAVIEVIQRRFTPRRLEVSEVLRGPQE